jgi:thiamine-phosphate pyrophosphorylase
MIRGRAAPAPFWEPTPSSAHAQAIADEPVDYACIGGVFPTTSKVNPNPPIGIDGFAALRRIIADIRPGMPVGAIAGITRERAASLIAAGGDGIAVVGAVLLAEDPCAAAMDLRQIVDAALAKRGA